MEALAGYTFGELMSEYLEWAETNKRHQNDEYRYRLHLKEYLGDRPLKDISPFLLESLKKRLQDKRLAPATIKHCLVIFRQAYNKAVLWGKWKGANPVKDIKLPKLDNRKERVLTKEEERALMAELKTRSYSTWAMSMIALYAGLRFEEIAKLRWQAMNLTKNEIHVDGKGGVPRIVPINSTLKNVLSELKNGSQSPSALLFPSRTGQVQGKISHSFWRTVNKLGLNNEVLDKRYSFDFHTLRHTWATRLGDAGAPLNALRDMGGWSDFQMVSRYVKSNRDLAKTAAQALDEISMSEEANVPFETS
jgi:integrase